MTTVNKKNAPNIKLSIAYLCPGCTDKVAAPENLTGPAVRGKRDCRALKLNDRVTNAVKYFK